MNALQLIVVTEKGIVTLLNLTQEWNELLLIEVTYEGIITSSNFEQDWKAEFSIFVIEEGNSILIKSLHWKKAFSPIDAT